MRFKRIISLAASCTVAVGSVMIAPAGSGFVSAEDSRKTELKWYDEIITLIQDDVADNGQHAQWYYMTDNSEFRTDGINVTYNQDVVTNNCQISFHDGDSPSKYYNGKSFEYDIPIDINFGGKDVISSVIAQIGKKNDANLDHLIDVRDAAIIARDVRTHIIFKKSEISDFARFLVSGNRQNNVYSIKSEDASYLAKDLAEKALKGSVGKKFERLDGTSGSTLSISSAKGRPGETIALQVRVTADNNFEALDAVVAWDGDAIDNSGIYPANKGISCETAVGDGKLAIVTYGDQKIDNGAISTLNMTIPENAKPGEELEVYFSDVNTFSVLGDEGSVDQTDSVNVQGAKVEVLEPLTTTPAVTTQAVTTTPVTTTTTPSVTTAPAVTTTEKTYQTGDANKDGKVDIRDAAFIAQMLSKQKADQLDKTLADYNKDGKVSIRDAAALAIYLSGKNK